MCVPIERVHRDAAGVLTHVGGSSRDGIPWGLTVAETAALQESRMYSFYVEVPVGQIVSVLVKTSPGGKKYLVTSPDGKAPNNLDALPDMPRPLAGVEPPFPLNIPGTLMTYLTTISSIGYSGGNTLTPLTSVPLGYGPTIPEFTRPTSFWNRSPRSFYINALVPFPADIRASENGWNLEQVPGDSPARRHALEAAGKGWWSLDYILTKPDGTIDPTKPTRLTEVRVIIRPGSKAWLAKNFTLSLTSFSINMNCYIHPPGENWAESRQGSSITFRVKEPAANPPPPAPATGTMPAVVGLHLDVALNTLYGLGFRNIFIIGPNTVIAADQKVDAQSPLAGETVKLKDSIYLTTSLIAAQTGIKKIVVSNQSATARPMDLWLFDYNTGTWDSVGTVDYQAQRDVDLIDGHTHVLDAVDPGRLNCHTGKPTEGPCVYQASDGTFPGDAQGIDWPWQIK